MSLLLGQRTPTVITSQLLKSMVCRDTKVPLRCLDLVSSPNPARGVQILGWDSSAPVQFRYLGRLHREVRWFGRLPRSWATEYPAIGRSSP